MEWFESMLGGVGWEGFREVWEDYTFKNFSCGAEEGDGPVRGAGVWEFSWFQRGIMVEDFQMAGILNDWMERLNGGVK